MNLFDPSPKSALEFLPARHDLASLRAAAKDCRGCDLYREATQVVFGEGASRAAIQNQDARGQERRRQRQAPDSRRSLGALGAASDLKMWDVKA